MRDKTPWTFMVYMAGECGLSDAGDNNLELMRKVGSTPEVNIVAEFDREDDQGTKRYYIQKDAEDDSVEDLGETDAGDPATLLNFVSWSIENYPAEKYALILWSHGSGWEPLDKDPKSGLSSQGMSLASELDWAFFRKTRDILRDHSSIERYVGKDLGSGHAIDTIELDNVLEKICNRLGKKLDLLGMDACFMSNFEVAYQIEAFVSFMVGSEERIPNRGWPYDLILQKLVNNPHQSAPQLANELVRDYIFSCRQEKETWATQSAFNLAKAKEISKKLDELAMAILDGMPKAASEIAAVQDIKELQQVSFSKKTLWDVSRLFEEVQKITLKNKIAEAARSVCSALQPDPDNFVIAESHVGYWYDKCCGASIYLIPPPRDVSLYYSDLKFARDTQWLSMLNAYHKYAAENL